MFFYYDCETIKGDNCEIVLKATSKEEALEKLKTYEVNRGELKYYHLTKTSKHGHEKYYHPKNNGTVLAVAMMGAVLGATQVNIYGINADYKKCLTSETIKIIKNNA